MQKLCLSRGIVAFQPRTRLTRVSVQPEKRVQYGECKNGKRKNDRVAEDRPASAFAFEQVVKYVEHPKRITQDAT